MSIQVINIFLVQIIAIVFFSLSSTSFASIIVFTGDAGEKLWIQNAPKLGPDAAVIKIEGIETDWQGKLIRVEKSNHQSGDRYHFDYKRGSKKLSYYPIVETSKTLISGTITRRMEVYVPPRKKDPIILKHDIGLTKDSQSLDLIGEFAKNPYKPIISP